MKTAVLAVSLAAMMIGASGCAQGPTAQSPANEPPVLRTQPFESGEMVLEGIPSPELERFIKDLCTRRDYSLACNDGKADNDSKYLAEWIDKVVKVLVSRGYRIDEEQNLRRPEEQ